MWGNRWRLSAGMMGSRMSELKVNPCHPCPPLLQKNLCRSPHCTLDTLRSVSVSQDTEHITIIVIKGCHCGLATRRDCGPQSIHHNNYWYRFTHTSCTRTLRESRKSALHDVDPRGERHALKFQSDPTWTQRGESDYGMHIYFIQYHIILWEESWRRA